MAHINTYEVADNGKLWVKLKNGHIREATEKEWLFIWQRDPLITVKIAA